MEETRADPHMKSGKCNFPRLCSISAAVRNAFSTKIYHVDNFSLMFSVVASGHSIQLGFRVSQGSAEPEGIWTVQTVQTCVVSLWFCSCFVSKEGNSHSKLSRRTSALSLLSKAVPDVISLTQWDKGWQRRCDSFHRDSCKGDLQLLGCQEQLGSLQTVIVALQRNTSPRAASTSKQVQNIERGCQRQIYSLEKCCPWMSGLESSSWSD